MVGEIGEAEKKGKTRQEISKIEAQTAVSETLRKSEKAKADAELVTTQTNLDMGVKLAQIQANRNAEARDAELQRDVETKRAQMELERRRAKDIVSAKIQREAAEQAADAAFYSDTKGADATQYKHNKEAEAAFYRAQKEADASFYAKKKEAEGISEIARAYGEMAGVLGGPQGLLQYMMLQNNTYEKLALANAKAIQGLSPKINVWNTGAAGEGGSAADPTAPIRNIMQTIPPLFSTIQDQTGITPPTWIANMPPQQQEYQQQVEKKGKGRELTNGGN